MKTYKIIVVLGSLLGIIVLLDCWYTYAPATSGIGFDYFGMVDPYDDLGRVVYNFYYLPIATVSMFLGLIVLIISRFRFRSEAWLIAPLVLLLVSLSTVVEPIFLRVRTIFSPIVNSALDRRYKEEGHAFVPKLSPPEILSAHYEFIKERITNKTTRVIKISCGLINTGVGLVLPVEIYDSAGARVGLSIMDSMAIQELRLDIVSRAQFDTLYSLPFRPPSGCGEIGSYGSHLIAGEYIGAIPAIIHILPSPTPSGSVVQ